MYISLKNKFCNVLSLYLAGEVVVLRVVARVRYGTLKYLNKLLNPENSSIRC